MSSCIQSCVIPVTIVLNVCINKEQHSFFPFENAVAKSLILDVVVAILVIHEC